MSDQCLDSAHLGFLPRRQEYRRARDALLGTRGWLTLGAEGWECWKGNGLWRVGVLGYSCLLVVDLPVDEDSLPLHVLGLEPAAKETQVAHFMAEASQRLENCSSVFASLHPIIWKELSAMARKKRKELEMDIRPTIEWVGLERAIEQIGKKRVIEQLGIDDILANLGPAKRRALKRRLEAESGKP